MSLQQKTRVWSLRVSIFHQEKITRRNTLHLNFEWFLGYIRMIHQKQLPDEKNKAWKDLKETINLSKDFHTPTSIKFNEKSKPTDDCYSE